MKIAVCSDIHSNLPALQAVLEDMNNQDVDTKVCLGDIVGYNAWPKETLDLVRDSFDIVVQGNHDRNVGSPEGYRSNQMAHEGLKHSKLELSDEDIDWLMNLPLQDTIPELNYLVVHEHPDSSTLGTRESYVFPRNFSRMIPHIKDEYDGLLMGHTHVRHTMDMQGYFVHNPGSVGQPRDGTIGAVYSLIEVTDDGVTCEKRVVEYDIDSVLDKVKEVGLPVKTARRITKGE